MIALVVVMLGGCQMSQTETISKEELRKEQENMALDVVKRFEGVELIEFGEIKKFAKTGSYSVVVTVNSESQLHFTFYDFNEDDYTVGWQSSEFHLKPRTVEVDNVSLENIKVIYWSVK